MRTRWKVRLIANGMYMIRIIKFQITRIRVSMHFSKRILYLWCKHFSNVFLFLSYLLFLNYSFFLSAFFLLSFPHYHIYPFIRPPFLPPSLHFCCLRPLFSPPLFCLARDFLCLCAICSIVGINLSVSFQFDCLLETPLDLWSVPLSGRPTEKAMAIKK